MLFGKSGNDLIRGASGDDILNGGLGNDTLRGQHGIDTADYSDLTFNGVFGDIAGLDVNLSQNSAKHSSNNNSLTWSDTLTSGSEIGTDTLIDIEFLKFDDALIAVDDSLFI